MYNFPDLGLLNDSMAVNDSDDISMEKLQTILDSFKIPAIVQGFVKGSRVTQYELKLNIGVPISRVKKYLDDIALWLGVDSIRLISLPDKCAIGLEVPNKTVETICIKSIIESDAFKQSHKQIPIGIGKTISGETVVGDIADMPHMLIAGATGSGKSVFINTLITSILYKATPEDVKFLMIDPKMVELSGYNGIPHLLAPVITAHEGRYNKALSALKWVVNEMAMRYDNMAMEGAKNINEYNQDKAEKIPRIVVIIDELADLMLSDLKDQIEYMISRIAAMGRAAGIHLVVATQRPDAKVLTGLIKANIPTRIAFMVSTSINSKIIIDDTGAENLLGKGDMLYLDKGKPIRIQGAYISNEETKRIVETIKGGVQYNADLINALSDKPIRTFTPVTSLYYKAS